MAKATLMVFLLDNIAGFSEMLNVTFEVLQKTNPGDSYIQNHYCDPTVAEPLLYIVDKELHNHEVEQTGDLYAPLISELSDDSKLNSLSFETSNEKDVESKVNTEDDTITKNLDRLLKQNITELAAKSVLKSANVSSTTVLPSKGTFPKSAPFLVAIFESLSNVTAQTCAGALLSPVWVLTTANCIDVLEDLDVNSNRTSKNSYMVVAGANNPFKDGTIHNVTEIYVYPDNSSCYPDDDKKAVKEKSKDNIVLMKLATPVSVNNVTAVKIANQRVVDHARVKLWGWFILNVSQSSTPATETHAMSKLGSVQTCDMNVTGTALQPSLCLSVAVLNNTLSNGGPILVLEDDEPRLLSLVSDSDGTLVQPLKRYSAWIDQLTYNLDIMNTLVNT